MKSETTKLLDKAKHAIHATQILLRDEEEEFAAGRAYYAMFYIAKALLCEKGLRGYTKHTAIHCAYGVGSGGKGADLGGGGGGVRQSPA